MIKLFILALFSLFLGISNVSALEVYFTVDDEAYTLENAKSFYEKYQTYTHNDEVYDLSKYDHVFYDKSGWVAFSDYDLYTVVNRFSEPYDFFVQASTNSHETSNEFIFKEDYFTRLSTTGYFRTVLPFYARGVKVPSSIKLFVKFKTELCANAGSFCSHSSGIDGDYTLVPITDEEGNLYGLLNLAEDEKKSVDYTVKIYLDDVLKDSYTESDFVGNSVTLKGLDDDKLRSDDSNVYEVVLVDGVNEFVLKYYSSTYGTQYQQIKTENNELWLPLNYEYIKTLFPSINFELWTSYEQFSFTLLFNLFFVLFMLFVSFLLIKLFYVLKGWFL